MPEVNGKQIWSGQNFSDIFTIQRVKKNLTHSYQMYTVLVNKSDRDNFLYYLNSKGIEVSAHFVPPLHKQNYLSKYSRKLPNTEKLAKTIVTLPIYPDLSKNELNKIFNHFIDVGLPTKDNNMYNSKIFNGEHYHKLKIMSIY